MIRCPEAISRASLKRRVTWARQYIDSIIQRDVRDVAGIEKLDQLPRFLRALAQTAGQMCNYTQIGGQVGLDGKTAARYIGVFEQMYGQRRCRPCGVRKAGKRYRAAHQWPAAIQNA